ncbi:MAG TPA: hypothetical protein VF665_16330, partial [Longimicrobium sp.]|uniref:hypothetical protein n=1 Tax=Longimicrobium sp. TaxID=2029185 RepID=UPI002ED83B03
HVPQLFPEEDFEQYFARHFPGIGSRHARRFCSLALVKLCAPGTWAETAASLGLPVSAATGMANRAIVVLKNCGAYELFARDLHAAAARLAKQPTTDYAHRRAVFAEFADIPGADWRDMCKAARVPPGQRGARSRYAAAWLWADLTGGDWTLAPALANTGLRKQRLVFQRLNKAVFPTLAPFLRAYGRQVLSATPDPRPMG